MIFIYKNNNKNIMISKTNNKHNNKGSITKIAAIYLFYKINKFLYKMK